MSGTPVLEERAAARHPHLTRPRRPGQVRMDCHLHTLRSGDSVTTLEEVRDLAAETGLDVIAVTDHHTLSGALRLREEAAGVRIVVGEEIRTRDGEIIGLFLTERVPYVLPLLEAARRIRGQGGVVCAPHPFDPGRRGLGIGGLTALAGHGLLDMVEVFNGKAPDPGVDEQAAAAAVDLGVPAGAGSDAHDPEGIGAAFIEIEDFDGPDEFLRNLGRADLAGALFPHANRNLPRRTGSSSRPHASRHAPSPTDAH